MDVRSLTVSSGAEGVGVGVGVGEGRVCKIVEDDELDERRMNSPLMLFPSG